MDIVDCVKNGLIRASTSYSDDVLAAYVSARDNASSSVSKWVFDLLLENANIAEKNKMPLCDDTGIPHLLFEIGENAELPRNLFEDARKGVELGLKQLPARPMAVKGNSIQRIEQSQGLYEQAEDLKPAPYIVQNTPGDKIKITILMLGGGPEIRSKTYRIFHQRNHNIISNKIIEWLSKELPLLGCTPAIPAIGIGRTHFEATTSMIKAMAYGNLNKQSTMENYITKSLNDLSVGPLGLKKDDTVLGTFIDVAPQRASGVRIVNVRPCCCVEPRRYQLII